MFLTSFRFWYIGRPRINRAQGQPTPHAQVLQNLVFCVPLRAITGHGNLAHFRSQNVTHSRYIIKITPTNHYLFSLASIHSVSLKTRFTISFCMSTPITTHQCCIPICFRLCSKISYLRLFSSLVGLRS